MFKHFINLEWKSFFRSASFKTNLVLKIFMVLGALYFIALFTGAGIMLYFGLEDHGFDPLVTVNKYLIYYLVADIVIRYFFQKMPVINIKPLLLLPFKKGKIVNYAFGKTAISYFNIVHAFFFIPFSIVLLKESYSISGVITWHLGIMFLIYINNFINIFLNDRTVYIVAFAGIAILLGLAQYYEYFDITTYTLPFFQALYDIAWMCVVPLVVLLVIIKIAYNYFYHILYLDAGLSAKQTTASTENLDWLDRFGKISTFLKNDIKLIKRNKRSRTTVLISFLFLFYGLLFFSGGIESYNNPVMRIFGGIFVSGGFLFTFGQFVPSWDSSYYPLMMSQNIRYKEYLTSKWWLVVIATVISTILASFYLYFGWEAYAAILVGAIYNIGVNSHLVLLGGAYIKTPIDLTSAKKAFGNSQAFNLKTMLISVPKLLLPLLLYALGHYTLGPIAGFALVAIAGVVGFAFRNMVFRKIESIYKAEKYKTLSAYKQNN
tara:strand:+ start:118616 stop:120085 length:1470 start_codon:yes stop_codon:yes gene_type:complete